MATSASSTSTSATAVNSMNVQRIAGLASGLDTESMVKSLMQAESAKYNKMAQQKQLMDWTKDANLAVNNQLKSFSDSYLTALSSSSSMLNSSSILTYKVTQDSSSSIVITAGSQAYAGSHVINSITSLASGASAASAAAIGSSSVSTSSKLSDLALTNALTFGDDGSLSFAINGKTFTFKSSDTLQSVINTVNGDSTANATMIYSSLTGKLSVTSKNLGSDSTLKIENITGNAFSDTNAAFGIAQGSFTNGTDAKLNIDGVDVTKSTNNFTIDGITYSLKTTSGTANHFSLDQDVDGAVTKIEGFVNAYNSLIDKLQSTIDEQRNTDYMPLTSDQKSSMSDSDVTAWNDKVKTGLLQDDTYVTKLLSDMRSAFYNNVASAGINASSIGLSTYSYETHGEILVDETKLRQALQNNPQQVVQVLTAKSYDTDASTKYKQQGTITRISDIVSRYLSDYNGYRTTNTNTDYQRLSDDMTAEQTRLNNKESQYWNEFNQMEQAMSQMNAQSSWLSAQFSSSKS